MFSYIKNYDCSIFTSFLLLFLSFLLTLFLTFIIFPFILFLKLIKIFIINIFLKFILILIALPIIILVPIMEQIIIWKYYIFKMTYIGILWNVYNFQFFNFVLDFQEIISLKNITID